MKITNTNRSQEKLTLIENFTLYLPYGENSDSYNLTLEDEGHLFRVIAKAWYSSATSKVNFIREDLTILNFYVDEMGSKGFSINHGKFNYQFIVDNLRYNYKLNVTKWEKG